MGFPLNDDMAYIENTGKRTTLGNKIGSGGGGEPYSLPTASDDTKGGVKIGNGLTMTGEVLSADAQVPAHTSAEAGKVLTVNDDGELEWNESGGAGGVYVGTNDPSASVGDDGDYYYKRRNYVKWLEIERLGSSTASTSIYGVKLKIQKACKITHLAGLMGSDGVGSLRIGTTSEILETISDIAFTANKMQYVPLQNPINAQVNDEYIIQIVISSGTMRHTSSKLYYADEYATYINSNYGGFPGTSTTSYYAPVSCGFETDYELVDTQYIKESGAWSKIG